jgi:hypothetical protein
MLVKKLIKAFNLGKKAPLEQIRPLVPKSTCPPYLKSADMSDEEYAELWARYSASCHGACYCGK